MILEVWDDLGETGVTQDVSADDRRGGIPEYGNGGLARQRRSQRAHGVLRKRCPMVTSCGIPGHNGPKINLAECPECTGSIPQWTDDFDDHRCMCIVLVCHDVLRYRPHCPVLGVLERVCVLLLF
jgi:hypothetical protein